MGIGIDFGGRIDCEAEVNGAVGIEKSSGTDMVRRSTRNASASVVVAVGGVVVADGIHYIQVEVGVHMNFAAVGNWGMANIAQIEMRVDTWGIAVGRMDEAHIEVPPDYPAGS